MGGVATLLTPVLLSLLADLRVGSRILIGTAFALAAAALGGLWLAETFAAIFVIYLIFALVLAPLPSLQDGLTFKLATTSNCSWPADLALSPNQGIRIDRFHGSPAGDLLAAQYWPSGENHDGGRHHVRRVRIS